MTTTIIAMIVLAIVRNEFATKLIYIFYADYIYHHDNPSEVFHLRQSASKQISILRERGAKAQEYSRHERR